MDPHPYEKKNYCVSEDEPLDSKLFSPLRSQLQAELGSSGIYYSDSNYLNFDTNANAVQQLQSGTEESDYIYQFIDSFDCNLDDFALEDFQIPNNTMASLDYRFYGEVEAENSKKSKVCGTFPASFSFLNIILHF